MVTIDSLQSKAFKAARTALAMSLAEASAGICSESYLSLIEAGKRQASAKMARQLAARLQVAAPEAKKQTKSRALALEAELAIRTGNKKQAKELLAKDSSDERASFVLGLIAEVEGNFESAMNFQEACLSNSGASNQTLMDSSIAMCRIAANQLQVATAIEVGERALREFATQSDVDSASVSELRATLSGVYCETGNMLRARQLTDPSLNDFGANDRTKVQELWSRSYVLAAESKFEEAAVLAQSALSLLEKMERPMKFAALKQTHAWYLLQDENADLGNIEKELLECITIAESADAKVMQANCRAVLGLVEAMRANKSASEEYFTVSLAELSGSDLAGALILKANASVRLGAISEAKSALQSARKLLEDSGASRSEAYAWRQLAAIYEELGEAESALACLKAATDLIGLSASPIAASLDAR
ncbi:MAG: helix-turn-helix transcriptional regulator [Rhodoluna sp.]|nr:helix-turn-helix transcriptional regulator [Rhodoluna sp.]MBP6186673.1 helix-turn-helix transcriptional regulator [Rhodoluna sp.]